MALRIQTAMGAFLAERLGGKCIHPRGDAVQADVAALVALVRARDAGRNIFLARAPDHSLWVLPFAAMLDEEAA